MFIQEDRASFIVWPLKRHSLLTFDWVSSQQTKDPKKWVFTAFPDWLLESKVESELAIRCAVKKCTLPDLPYLCGKQVAA